MKKKIEDALKKAKETEKNKKKERLIRKNRVNHAWRIIHGIELIILHEPKTVNIADDPVVRTMHTLDMYVDEKVNHCPFDEGIEMVSERCMRCEHNIRRKHNAILPCMTRECARYYGNDHHRHPGDWHEHDEYVVIANPETLIQMFNNLKAKRKNERDRNNSSEDE